MTAYKSNKKNETDKTSKVSKDKMLVNYQSVQFGV